MRGACSPAHPQIRGMPRFRADLIISTWFGAIQQALSAPPGAHSQHGSPRCAAAARLGALLGTPQTQLCRGCSPSSLKPLDAPISEALDLFRRALPACNRERAAYRRDCDPAALPWRRQTPRASGSVCPNRHAKGAWQMPAMSGGARIGQRCNRMRHVPARMCAGESAPRFHGNSGMPCLIGPTHACEPGSPPHLPSAVFR